jgi:hypothetical protein
MKTMPSAIVAFLEGAGLDHRGRRVDDIIAFDDAALETVHDYIQWLFPLAEPSGFNPHAPVLSAGDIETLRFSEQAQINLRTAAGRMKRFYEENRHWLRAYDHNHLRISRIIGSLCLLAGRSEAQSFHNAIERIVVEAGNPVSGEARGYWKRAMEKTC